MGAARSPRQVLAEHQALLGLLTAFEQSPARALDTARECAARIRREVALEQAATIPIARLKDTARGLRLEAMERAGYRTVADLAVAREYDLLRIPGVGDATASQAIAAARQVVTVTENVAVIRFDVDRRATSQTELLVALRNYVTAQRAAQDMQPTATWFRNATENLPEVAEPATKSWVVRMFTRSWVKAAANEAVGAVAAVLADPRVASMRALITATEREVGRPRSNEEIWQDYETNAAQLLAALAEVLGTDADPANRGHLPADIVERVEAFKLDQLLLTASLRGYQAFGAKYALVQRRTVLGDEMGLGKTVEALAAACHLAANGSNAALVVCPASVVANWRSEIHRHTKLTAHVIHGIGREAAERAWHRSGGVAITTYDGLRRLDRHQSAMGQQLGLLIVDEAHYVKNPAAKRSQAVAEWVPRAGHALFLTGTPMENRVSEFRTLIEYLQPDVATRVDATTAMAAPAAFQTAVAPAYLRRNQSDVLAELPDMIQSLDWVDATQEDLAEYRQEVANGSFMSMRRAAYRSVPAGGPSSLAEIERSAKLARLIDIAEEAAAEGLKLVVFSFFRDVLDVVTKALCLAMPGAVYGPLTGSVQPAERQRMVDQLTAHNGGAALVSQIEAGGVGLNIQAASVVVLCEPQWKPTVESQAIARAHRMGQVRRVQVHRLLLDESVDQRMLEILTGKQQLIDQFVRESAIKQASPSAIDISDLAKVEQVVDEAQAEAAIVEFERRRLGVGARVQASADTWPPPTTTEVN